MSSIFPTLGIDRNKVRWEDYLTALTPWEQRGGLWFKREDYFAPLGYGGPNGSKMRQLIWYINRFRAGKTRLLTGASVQSPQLSMRALRAALPAGGLLKAKQRAAPRESADRRRIRGRLRVRGGSLQSRHPAQGR
jgi:hypothetical protein